MMIEKPSVIWVGPADGDDLQELGRAIRGRGLGFTRVERAEDLPGVLSLHAHAVVVACDRQTQQRSRDVVASVSRVGRRVPILVLVEESDFGDYYDLMERGVRYYYEFREGPERICGALSRAVNFAAA